MTISPRLPRRRFPQGIQGKLILILCVLIIPTILIQIYVYHERFETRRAQELQTNLEMARAVAKTFGIFVKETLHQELAIGLALASKDLSLADKDAILNAVKAEDHALWELFWINTEGLVIAATGSHFIGIDLADRAYFRQIVSGKEWAISDLLLSRVSNLPTFTLSRGIRDGRGELLGILVAAILPERLNVVLGIERSTDAAVAILDSKGMLVYRHPARDFTWEQRKWIDRNPRIAEALQSKEIVGNVVSQFDENRLVSYSPIPLCGWVGSASQVESTAMAAIHAALLPQATAFLLITLAVLGIALVSSRKISASIEKLRDHALALGRGETPIPVGLSGTVELDDLGRAFTKMSEEIQSRENERKQAEEALRESEERHRSIFENSLDGIILSFPDGRIIAANPEACRMHGYTEAEICRLGRDGIADKSDPRLSKLLQDRSQTGRHRGDVTHVRRDGTRFQCETSSAVFKDKDEREACVLVIRDITERKRAEEALLAREAFINGILGSITDALLVLDSQWRYTFVNDEVVRRTGKRREELMGRNVWELYPEAVGTEPHRLLHHAMAERVPVEYEIFYPPLNGWFTDKAYPTSDGGLAIFSRDITERRQAEQALQESQHRLAAALEIAALSVWEYRQDTGVIEFDQRSSEILGTGDQRAMTIEEFLTFVHGEDRQRVSADMHSALDPAGEGLYDTEYRIVTPDGVQRWLAARGHAIFMSDGQGRQLVRAIGTVMDVTERNQAEEALLRSRDELELRVRERTAELERKNRELQEFAFVASHDLNEPLRKIQTFGSLLREKSAERLGEQNIDYISRMTAAADRMRELLDALLRYSRVETQGRDPVLLELEEIVQAVATDLEVSMKKISAHVEIGPLPVIKGDPYQWRQLFQNLLANAIKYHRSEVKTVIKIYGEKNSGTALISVEDNGIGFDEKYLDKVFQAFQRLHGKHEYPGIGIGLAICKKIVERHGGTITAKSSPGRGSNFIITLPVDGTQTTNREGYTS